jgi:hypothetical protein
MSVVDEFTNEIKRLKLNDSKHESQVMVMKFFRDKYKMAEEKRINL